MWLAYMRFDSVRDTRVALVKCGSKAVYEEVLAAAKTFRGWELTEYAVFQAHNTIRARVVPNFAEELIFEADDFLRKCGAAPGVKGPMPPSSGGKGRPALGSGGRPSLPSGS